MSSSRTKAAHTRSLPGPMINPLNHSNIPSNATSLPGPTSFVPTQLMPKTMKLPLDRARTRPNQPISSAFRLSVVATSPWILPPSASASSLSWLFLSSLSTRSGKPR
uniref:Uncharacterized protein n=1 Tax=Brassica campestris TaxID=3711 RepID=A0A3P5ZVK9_BRACM|nr:unnamed protein product [Brassica rapa]